MEESSSRRHGDNPFDVDPALDRLHPVRADVAGWSETCYFHVWNPEEGVGAFVHAGRWPGDLTLWWAQVIALLPDGGLVVDRSWGRAPDDAGPATGNLAVRCLEPLRRWRLRFDGAGEPATCERMAREPVGAGRAVTLSFDVELEALAPVWDLHAAAGATELGWAAVHHTQGFRSTGRLTSSGSTWSLDGVAHRDHSSGPRHLDDVGGLGFFLVVFPHTARVANGLVTLDRDGAPGHRLAASQQDGCCEIGTDVRIPGLTDLATLAPRTTALSLGVAGGPREELAVEVLHGYVLTLLEPNENVNGAALDAEDDPLLVTQSTVRVRDPDGEVGYGVLERDRRRSLLPRS